MKFQNIPKSQARERLAAAISEQNEAVASVEALQAAMGRLASAAADVGPATSALAKLDADEASAFAAWSRHPDKPRPTHDAEGRRKLVDAIEVNKSAAEAAARAYLIVEGDLAAATARIAVAETSVNAAAAQVVGDELETAAAELAAKIAETHKARIRVNAGWAVLVEMAQKASDNSLSLRLEALDGRIAESSGFPAIEPSVMHGAATSWRAFADSLKVDSNVLRAAP